MNVAQSDLFYFLGKELKFRSSEEKSLKEFTYPAPKEGQLRGHLKILNPSVSQLAIDTPSPDVQLPLRHHGVMILADGNQFHIVIR